ncbi:MAG: NAD-dependent succinate-semialdehyde dehydrogenase [Gammaproteobacteria bacterium]|nr:NAD-dependent succinate-semialdehyde dehydrogenase [Gammaproteobacteria bacterium]
MSFQSINPATGEMLARFDSWDASELERALSQVADANRLWCQTVLEDRCALLRKAAEQLRRNKQQLATLICQEMGKLFSEAQAEVEKCAVGCEYYADNGPLFLQHEVIASDAANSYVCFQPLGTILAIMPWNFPLWQVFRFAVPALIAGNTAILKHASNVPQCALAIESIFIDAGFPKNVFRTLMIDAVQVASVIEDARVHAVTLTGSESAGRIVAAQAGASLKKSVLELGGSDAFVVLEDADLALVIDNAVTSRFLNAGQSCIAAKRFIVVAAVMEKFTAGFKAAVEALVVGDPMDANTDMAPMARADLREELHQQVLDSIQQGARVITGCNIVAGAGVFYQASILGNVRPGMRAYDEELFGPVASVIQADDEADALHIANDTRFGLGGSVWTGNQARGEQFALQMQAGAIFVNGFVKSDPRLPFGGIKASGYGRELSYYGMREFMNTKTIWLR